MKTIPLLAIATLPAIIWVTFADEKPVPEAEIPWEKKAKPVAAVGALFEWIELDHRKANQLIRKHATKTDSDELREIVEQLLDEGKAELVETVYLPSHKNMRAKSESIEEHIYPTEYDPPEIPTKIPKDFPRDKIPISPANPTAFDVRNTGTTVEFDSTVSPDTKIITLELAPEIVRHLGNRTIGDPKVLHASMAHVYQPEFHVMRAQTQLRVHEGKHCLVGLASPAGKGDKRVMLFVRANVLR